MYNIYFYKDKNVNEPVAEYIRKLSNKNGRFVLLHQFMKKTQKTPKREIEKAKRELSDLIERGINYK